MFQAPVVVKQEPVPTIEEDSPALDSTPTPALVAMPNEDTTQVVIEVVVDHTGYPADFVELDQDLEGELGIDTVKQAEIMADIRAKFGLPVDEDFVLADYPTLNHMIAYIHKMQGGEVSAPAAPAKIVEPEVPVEPPAQLPVTQPQSIAATPVVQSSADISDIQPKLISVVVKHTGYPEDFIEMDQDLEGELGIDTVKQAEIMGDVRKYSLYQLTRISCYQSIQHSTISLTTSSK